MSDNIFQDLFESNNLNEKIESVNDSSNPYSFQSFIENKKVDQFTEVTRVNNEQQSANTQPDVIPDQGFDFSDETKFASDDNLSVDKFSDTEDNPFSFRRFQKSQLSGVDNPSNCANSKNEDLLNCPIYTENEYTELQKENSVLTKTNIQLQKDVALLNRKNVLLSQKLNTLQKKDSKEAKALEQVIRDVEASLDKANFRALTAENNYEQLLKDYAKLKTLCNLKLQEYFEQQTERACAKLRLASTEAEYLLNQLLLGVGNLRQTANFIESMHKAYESDI